MCGAAAPGRKKMGDVLDHVVNHVPEIGVELLAGEVVAQGGDEVLGRVSRQDLVGLPVLLLNLLLDSRIWRKMVSISVLISECLP
jgi:hypothetical protein